MPWTCCNESEVLPDNLTCPDCGKTKASYTIRFQKTRVFKISRKGQTLELELIDHAGDPVPDAPYWVKFPNDEIVEGTLDEEGYVKLKAPAPGMCQVKFTNWYAHDFDEVKSFQDPSRAPEPPEPFEPEPNEVPFLELEVRTADGDPVPFQPFCVEFPDGTAVESRLDEDGRIRLETAEAGTCKVRFPGWLSHDFDEVDAFVRLPDPEPPEEPPLPESVEVPFLEFSFQDPKGKGVPHQPYVVTLPDGKMVLDRTDEDGRARLECAEAGTCKVRFPGWLAHDFAEDVEAFDETEVDVEEPEDPEPEEPEPSPWLELSLRTHDGSPVRFQPYWIKFPDGTEQTGELDEDGTARVETTEPGKCEVKFAGWLAHDFEDAE